MKFGNVEIKIGANEIVIGSVVTLTFFLLFVGPPQNAIDLFKQGFQSLIAWGAGYAVGKISQPKGE